MQDLQCKEAPGSVYILETYLAKVLVQWFWPEGQICGLNWSVNLKYEQLQWRMWETHRHISGIFFSTSTEEQLPYMVKVCQAWTQSQHTRAHAHISLFFSWENGLHKGLVGDKLRSRAHGSSVFSHCSWGSFSLCSDDVNQYLNLFRWWICVLWQLYCAVKTLSRVCYEDGGHFKNGTDKHKESKIEKPSINSK